MRSAANCWLRCRSLQLPGGGTALGSSLARWRWVSSAPTSHEGGAPQDAPAKPEEPAPEECCGRGCEHCVWTVYWQALGAYHEACGTPQPPDPFEVLERRLRQEQLIKDNSTEVAGADSR